MLNGRFHHWMPVTLINGKDNEGLAQILFDVTSNRSAPSSAALKSEAKPEVKGGAKPASRVAAPKNERPLFEFVTTSVKNTGPQSYRLLGRMRAGIYSGDVEAVLESPRGHTPFFAITFTIDREKFAKLWTAFEDRAAEAIANGQDELRPWAWLREPMLAAA